MSHERMACGSTVAATLPVATAFAAKVRPAATSMETRPFTSALRVRHSPRRARCSCRHRQQ